MRCSRRTPLAVFVAAVLLTTPLAPALECDQFTVPDAPLPDLGADVGALVWKAIEEAVSATNRQIAEAGALAEATGRDRHRMTVERFLRPELIGRRLQRELGVGFPETRIEIMLREAFTDRLHEPEFRDSIYCKSGFARPLNNIGVVPTINLHGVYLGIDKLGHLFQQGAQYHRAYRFARARGLDHEASCQCAVRVGMDQERGVFGVIPSGAYSNADLAAN